MRVDIKRHHFLFARRIMNFEAEKRGERGCEGCLIIYIICEVVFRATTGNLTSERQKAQTTHKMVSSFFRAPTDIMVLNLNTEIKVSIDTLFLLS